MKRALGALIAAVTLLAGCASVDFDFKFKAERHSSGQLTPVNKKIPERIVGSRSPFGPGCNPCGGGINSGGGMGTIRDVLGTREKIGPHPRRR